MFKPIYHIVLRRKMKKQNQAEAFDSFYSWWCRFDPTLSDNPAVKAAMAASWNAGVDYGEVTK